MLRSPSCPSEVGKKCLIKGPVTQISALTALPDHRRNNSSPLRFTSSISNKIINMKTLVILTCVLGVSIIAEAQLESQNNSSQNNSSQNNRVSNTGTCNCQGNLPIPICGKNGDTFDNICEANCKSEEVECNQECPCPPSAPQVSSKSATNVTIASILAKPTNSFNSTIKEVSVQPKPCSVAIKKVCADNGTTFENACKAENSGLKVQCKGECPCQGNNQSCPNCCNDKTPACQSRRVDCSRCNN